jgi:hypothetical protein
MRGRPAERTSTIREFGAAGNGLCCALGVAAARRQGRDGRPSTGPGPHVRFELRRLTLFGSRVVGPPFNPDSRQNDDRRGLPLGIEAEAAARSFDRKSDHSTHGGSPLGFRP